MRIAIGGDHAGYPLKQHLIGVLKEWRPRGRRPRHRLRGAGRLPDLLRRGGPRGGRAAAPSVGIVLGGSGQGEQIAANKVRGVRAALCNDLYTAAHWRRQHNDANVLSIGARIVAPRASPTRSCRSGSPPPFEGGRHQRRIDEIAAIENEEIPT